MVQSLWIRIGFLIAFSVVAISGFWIYLGPRPQELAYHQFADQRPLLGVPHALNVLSNAPFVVVGLAGLAFMASHRSRRPGVFVETVERWPYWMYFVGLTLTGIGSGYYHADPNNATLVWDRLPLTLAFMGLFTAVLAERVYVGCARWLLGPLAALGAASVFYWDWTERVGAGDLRFYLTVQFFPLAALPFLLVFGPPRYTQGGDLLASLLCYVLAKICESLDQQVYTGAGFVSGHTMKHLIAGVAAGFILLMLWRRQPTGQGPPALTTS